MQPRYLEHQWIKVNVYLLLKLICKFCAKLCVFINHRPSAFVHTSPAVKFVEQYQIKLKVAAVSFNTIINHHTGYEY